MSTMLSAKLPLNHGFLAVGLLAAVRRRYSETARGIENERSHVVGNKNLIHESLYLASVEQSRVGTCWPECTNKQRSSEGHRSGWSGETR
jgi:hypothetical protein